MRSIPRIKKQIKRFDEIAKDYFTKKNYKDYVRVMSHLTLLLWVLGKNNQWENRLRISEKMNKK